jgi:cell division protein FtsX
MAEAMACGTPGVAYPEASAPEIVQLYLGLFVVTLVGALAMIPPDVLEQQLSHPVGAGDYLQLAWLVTSIATIGGALGSLVESDLSVRTAAQRSREAAEREDG